MGLSASQSSETWHDNFGHEDGVRQQTAMSVHIRQLIDVKNSAVLVRKKDTSSVDVGTRVVLEDDETGEKKTFLVGSYMVLKPTSPDEISYNAPILQPFFRTHVGESKEVLIGGKKKSFTVTSIA
jgi:transcription elongation GreA/GreB family factor